MKKIMLVMMLCLVPVMGNAANFVVVDASKAKFGWDFAVPLQTGESWQLTCNPIPTGTAIVKTGITVMPYPVNSALTVDGAYSCFLNFVTATGVVSAPSNTITVTVKSSKMILEVQ